MSVRFKSFGKRFREALRRGGKGVLLPAWRESYGETPAITFEDLIEIYLKDYAAKAAVDFLADQAVGVGFYTTINEDYEKASEVKEAVDGFNEAVNLDGLLQSGVREVVATGNSFWEKVTPAHLENLKLLPITSIEKVLRDQYGAVQGYKQTASYGGKTLAPETIIHFRWNPINGDPFGTGLLRVLAEKLTVNGETRESLIDAKARIEKIMPEIFEKYAGPDELWIFDVSDDKLSTYQQLIKNKPKAGARFVHNKTADIKTVQVDPRARFESYIDHIVNQFYLGLETPLPKLFTTPGFTEASARAALELADRKVLALQRFLKRIIEREIFTPIITQAGYDAQEAECRLNWGSPTAPDLPPPEVMTKWAELNFIRTEELRNAIIKNYGIELWEPEEKTE